MSWAHGALTTGLVASAFSRQACLDATFSVHTEEVDAVLGLHCWLLCHGHSNEGQGCAGQGLPCVRHPHWHLLASNNQSCFMEVYFLCVEVTIVVEAALWKVGEGCHLLQLAAAQGFWDTPKTGLVKIAIDLDVDVNHSSSLPPTLFSSVSTVVGHELSVEEQLKLMRLRMPESSPFTELLQLEETGELLDPQEKADIEKHMTKDKPADSEVVVAVRSLAKEL